MTAARPHASDVADALRAARLRDLPDPDASGSVAYAAVHSAVTDALDSLSWDHPDGDVPLDAALAAVTGELRAIIDHARLLLSHVHVARPHPDRDDHLVTDDVELRPDHDGPVDAAAVRDALLRRLDLGSIDPLDEGDAAHPTSVGSALGHAAAFPAPDDVRVASWHADPDTGRLTVTWTHAP